MPSRRTPLKVAFRRPWPSTRRGLKLWAISLVIGLKGSVYAQAGASSSSDSSLRLITERLHIPLMAWGLLIITIAAFSVFSSYCVHGRDKNGFKALAAFCGVNIGAYLASRILLDAPQAATQGALSWLLIGFLVLLIAADHEPSDIAGLRRRLDAEDDQ